MYFPAEVERIQEGFWQGKEHRWVKDSHPYAFQINSLIMKKLDLLYSYVYRQKCLANPVTLAGIAEYQKKKADANVFNGFLDEFIKKLPSYPEAKPVRWKAKIQVSLMLL
ncbi:MAG: hypothetical protein WKF87_01865 [Chryseolinea sp.]